MWRRNINSTAGSFRVAFSARGLCELHFPGAAAPKSCIIPETPPPPDLPRWIRHTTAALNAVLGGKPPTQLPPLDLEPGTHFQKRVWQALLKIPLGEVRTYSELAASLGKPGAARAVGTACGANPVGILVPCHRVVAANGGLGGFSGGLEWKKRLLRVEEADTKLKLKIQNSKHNGNSKPQAAIASREA